MKKNTIPKKIHYVWVGDKPKPQKVIDCIKTWQMNLPDYEIIEWNNDCLKEINNIYVKQAYDSKKWAFVSDYIRLYALYHQGGIYLDTDVVLYDSFDKFLGNDFFSCYENYKGTVLPIMSAVMGSVPRSDFIYELLNYYKNKKFNNGKKLDLEPNTLKISRFFQKKYNLNPPYDEYEKTELKKGMVIYPSYYFCSPKDGKKNYAIHLFEGSWITTYTRKDKLKLFGKLIFTRFTKKNDNNDSLPLNEREFIILKFKISSNKIYTILWSKNK
ncbi:glycosyltransferase [Arsenophonus nasoniae]|uniref:Glycosyltransferase sugar-binding region containing DXD motif protein n=1 Tax=Arsenophonus nasoniae TaxID=638 RepID=D2TYN3_9GAMM|nr:glycosyltransferase [Arsenophonus nasoniae]QBY43960.1 Glycosyltransferase sugar-binding region containing DXD motif protein [Arsenophonus nasoniae]WGM09380.1 glycosyltransferase [Arsenophonus nasoniae]WGM14105.1 glycosyltransferase [Arsenophonus nasoniae]CBA72533.1 mannosyltransferase OCH1 related enzyme [Arsenophonus nasoniae]